jgi:hypothetical protein
MMCSRRGLVSSVIAKIRRHRQTRFHDRISRAFLCSFASSCQGRHSATERIEVEVQSSVQASPPFMTHFARPALLHDHMCLRIWARGREDDCIRVRSTEYSSWIHQVSALEESQSQS